jgi:hypothetical protein
LACYITKAIIASAPISNEDLLNWTVGSMVVSKASLQEKREMMTKYCCRLICCFCHQKYARDNFVLSLGLSLNICHRKSLMTVRKLLSPKITYLVTIERLLMIMIIGESPNFFW